MTKIQVKYLQRIDTIYITDMNNKTFVHSASELRRMGIHDNQPELNIEWIDGEPYWVETI